MSFEAMTWASRQKVGSSSAKALLIVMANLADEQGFCYPSQAYLSEVLEQDIKTVQKNLIFLRERRFVIDTGERTGVTKQVIVYSLSMSESPPNSGELNTPKNGRHPKTEDIRFSLETPPNFPKNTPKNGGRTLKEYKGNKSNTSSKPDDRVSEVFDFWKATMNSPRSVLDKNRISRIQDAIKSFSVDDLKKAIRGCSKSSWNMGANPDGKKHNGIGLILRNAENIERFIGMDDEQASTDTKPWEV